MNVFYTLAKSDKIKELLEMANKQKKKNVKTTKRRKVCADEY